MPGAGPVQKNPLPWRIPGKRFAPLPPLHLWSDSCLRTFWDPTPHLTFRQPLDTHHSLQPILQPGPLAGPARVSGPEGLSQQAEPHQLGGWCVDFEGLNHLQKAGCFLYPVSNRDKQGPAAIATSQTFPVSCLPPHDFSPMGPLPGWAGVCISCFSCYTWVWDTPCELLNIPSLASAGPQVCFIWPVWEFFKI